MARLSKKEKIQIKPGMKKGDLTIDSPETERVMSLPKIVVHPRLDDLGEKGHVLETHNLRRLTREKWNIYTY